MTAEYVNPWEYVQDLIARGRAGDALTRTLAEALSEAVNHHSPGTDDFDDPFDGDESSGAGELVCWGCTEDFDIYSCSWPCYQLKEIVKAAGWVDVPKPLTLDPPDPSI